MSQGVGIRRGAVPTPIQPPSGHVFRVERRRGPSWYAKYRLPDGRQVQRKIGLAWMQRGRPPAGYYTKRLAEDWLRDVFDQARRGTLPGMVRTGATFESAASRAAEEQTSSAPIRPKQRFVRTLGSDAFGGAACVADTAQGALPRGS